MWEKQLTINDNHEMEEIIMAKKRSIKVVYEPKAAEPAVKVPFLVKVSISDLNIRKGTGTDYGRVQFCPVGVYTIMEVKAGQGSKAGWGRLKSRIGWLSLDFCKRV